MIFTMSTMTLSLASSISKDLLLGVIIMGTPNSIPFGIALATDDDCTGKQRCYYNKAWSRLLCAHPLNPEWLPLWVTEMHVPNVPHQIINQDLECQQVQLSQVFPWWGFPPSILRRFSCGLAQLDPWAPPGWVACSFFCLVILKILLFMMGSITHFCKCTIYQDRKQELMIMAILSLYLIFYDSMRHNWPTPSHSSAIIHFHDQIYHFPTKMWIF